MNLLQWGMRRFAVALLAPLLFACTSTTEDPPAPLPGAGGEFIENYPAGPYGTTVGDTLPSYDFDCYARPGTSRNVADVSLADLFNSTGEADFGAASAFPEGEAKPKLLMIDVSASYCAPCAAAAATELPELYAEYHPKGVEFMVILLEGALTGVGATVMDLDAWVDSFPIDYAACLDPARQIEAVVAGSFPNYILVDLRTMEMVQLVTASPKESFWAVADQLLEE